MLNNDHKQISVKPEIEDEYQKQFEIVGIIRWFGNIQKYQVGIKIQKVRLSPHPPWRLVEYWNWTNNFNADEYDF